MPSKLSFLLPAIAVVLASAPSVLAADSDTSTDKPPIGGFVPKKIPALIACALFALSGTIHWMHLIRMGKRFMLVLPTAMYLMAAGFGLRIIFANDPTAMMKYIITDMLTLLSPCAFLATNYVLLKHLSLAMGEEIADQCMFIRSSRVVVIFVISDVLTFFVQSGGGGFMASAKTPSQQHMGEMISLLGLILQLASFILYILLLIVFGMRVKSRFPATWSAGDALSDSVWSDASLFSSAPIRDWRLLFQTMILTSIGILIRCIFRVLEAVGGYSGYLATHEGYLYCFDTIPLWIAMTLYCFVWPPRLDSSPALDTMPLTTQGYGNEQPVAFPVYQQVSEPDARAKLEEGGYGYGARY